MTEGGSAFAGQTGQNGDNNRDPAVDTSTLAHLPGGHSLPVSRSVRNSLETEHVDSPVDYLEVARQVAPARNGKGSAPGDGGARRQVDGRLR